MQRCNVRGSNRASGLRRSEIPSFKDKRFFMASFVKLVAITDNFQTVTKHFLPTNIFLISFSN